MRCLCGKSATTRPRCSARSPLSSGLFYVRPLWVQLVPAAPEGRLRAPYSLPPSGAAAKPHLLHAECPAPDPLSRTRWCTRTACAWSSGVRTRAASSLRTSLASLASGSSPPRFANTCSPPPPGGQFNSHQISSRRVSIKNFRLVLIFHQSYQVLLANDLYDPAVK